ncbi:hypothetical protein Tco_0653421 [Tanacetum coccineum]|uniref:Uncharacterized protein n=1 Tax=Tanacetum coccineum TaxID=301880 RepID=A0ABQ4X0B7_9ASTR
MAVFDLNQPASSLSEEDDVAASSSINTGFDSHVVSVSSSINTGCDSFASNDDNASNNHRRSVTVGSGLLKKETAKAYGCELRASRKLCPPPNIVIVSRIYDDTDFKDKFGKIVWNIFIGPEEFEDRWTKLMEEFNLVNHKWLSKMKWISEKRTKNQTKTDKTKHGMEKRGKDKVKSKPKSKKSKSKFNPKKSTVKTEPILKNT